MGGCEWIKKNSNCLKNWKLLLFLPQRGNEFFFERSHSVCSTRSRRRPPVKKLIEFSSINSENMGQNGDERNRIFLLFFFFFRSFVDQSELITRLETKVNAIRQVLTVASFDIFSNWRWNLRILRWRLRRLEKSKLNNILYNFIIVKYACNFIIWETK